VLQRVPQLEPLVATLPLARSSELGIPGASRGGIIGINKTEHSADRHHHPRECGGNIVDVVPVVFRSSVLSMLVFLPAP
jgi:hypothetical protein